MLYLFCVTYILIGIYQKKFQPKKISLFYGYKTKTARRDQEIWNEAQKFSANLIIVHGVIFGMTGLTSSLFKVKHVNFISIILLVISIFTIFRETEKHLKSLKKNEDEQVITL